MAPRTRTPSRGHRARRPRDGEAVAAHARGSAWSWRSRWSSRGPSSRGSRRLRVRLPAVTRSRRRTCRASARTTRTSDSPAASIRRRRRSCCTTGPTPTRRSSGSAISCTTTTVRRPVSPARTTTGTSTTPTAACASGWLVVGGEDSTPQECADRGGHKVLLIDIWMMHAWVVPGFECSWGVFSGECPELGGRLGGTAWEAPESSKS